MLKGVAIQTALKMFGHANDSMDKGSIFDSEDRTEKIVDIYVTAEAVRDMKYRKDKEDLDNKTQKTQTPQHTGSDSVRSRSSRAAVVCLVLLCVLLLTAVIVLCVHIYTNYTQERDQLLTKINNLTEDRHELIIKNKNLMNVIKLVAGKDGWTYYQSSIYYMSKEMMNWTESRRYCMDTGADLIIINNTEKQEFVKNMSGGAAVWIGVTDSDVEGTWKWVDGRNVTSE
ncbi:hypothetical protein cypCar_00006784 [Cyprinus carpio]|nr:hypothetical protein cypCar_00006784 [Cyprinus carpio]